MTPDEDVEKKVQDCLLQTICYVSTRYIEKDYNPDDIHAEIDNEVRRRKRR